MQSTHPQPGAGLVGKPCSILQTLNRNEPTKVLKTSSLWLSSGGLRGSHCRLRSSEELEELMTARMVVHTSVTEAMRAAPKATRTR